MGKDIYTVDFSRLEAARVTALTEVAITPVAGDDYGSVVVTTQDNRKQFRSRTRAAAWARKEGRRIVREKALAQGARGEIEITEQTRRQESTMGYGTIWLGDTLRFTATGNSLG